MTKYEIFQAITNNPAFYLATAERDQPHVRAMFLYKADESGVLFHTAKAKDVHKQLSENKKVELCFSCNGMQIRITGEVEEIDDNGLKDEICDHPTRKFLKTWRENGAFKDFYKDIAVYRLKNGDATVWSMDKNFASKEKIQL